MIDHLQLTIFDKYLNCDKRNPINYGTEIQLAIGKHWQHASSVGKRLLRRKDVQEDNCSSDAHHPVPDVQQAPGVRLLARLSGSHHAPGVHHRLLPLHLLLVQVPCLRDGVATTFNCADLSGKFVLLLFQPVDFGYIGPTELELLDNLSLDCEVSTPTIFRP